MIKIRASRYKPNDIDGVEQPMRRHGAGQYTAYRHIVEANSILRRMEFQIIELQEQLAAAKDALETRDLLEIAVMKQTEMLINEKLGLQPIAKTSA